MTLLSRAGNIEFGHLKAQDRARPQEAEKQKEVVQLKQVSRKKTEIEIFLLLLLPEHAEHEKGRNSNISWCRFNPLTPKAIIILCLLNLLLQYHW